MSLYLLVFLAFSLPLYFLVLGALGRGGGVKRGVCCPIKGRGGGAARALATFGALGRGGGNLLSDKSEQNMSKHRFPRGLGGTRAATGSLPTFQTFP
jgi:hypothetical protein